MTFNIFLNINKKELLPINYSYPLSAAIYRIISKGDSEYAAFLHEKGYGKGFKLFTFSQLNVPFKIEGDRLRLLSNEVNFQVNFHLPQAMESFVKGLFQSEEIVIADKKSKVVFTVKTVESLPNPLLQYNESEIINISTKPLSPVVSGLMKSDRNYDFLSPEDPQFVECLIYNWRSKIETCYNPKQHQLHY